MSTFFHKQFYLGNQDILGIIINHPQCHDGPSDFGNNIPMLVRPENMRHVTTLSPQKYNKKPKQDHSSVPIHNFMPSPNCDVYQVKIRHDVFQHVCKIHSLPEKCSNEAYQMMARILGEHNQRDREYEVKVASDRAD